MQSRAAPSQERRVRGAAGYLAPMTHPPIGPGAAEASMQRPAYEEGEAEVSALASSLHPVHDLRSCPHLCSPEARLPGMLLCRQVSLPGTGWAFLAL